MLNSQRINFTEGKIARNLVLFSLPIIISELLQNLYNSVDSIVVGKMVGDAALAAISVCLPIANLLVNFFTGMSVGNTVVVAKSYGRGDREATSRAIQYAFTFSVVSGVVISALGIVLAKSMLNVSKCNEEIFGEAIVYLRIYLAGLMFTVIYNCGTGILRAIGDSTTPLYILAGTSILNIGLDLLFVAVFHWGTAGVAIATVLAQGLSMVLVMLLIRQKIGMKCFDLRETRQSGMGIIRESLNVGLSAGMQNALISFSNIFVWRYINIFDTEISAGLGASFKVDRFVVMPCKAFAMTTTTYVSQNLGANNPARARKGIRHCLLLSTVVTMGLAFIILPLRNTVMGWFSNDPLVIMSGAGMVFAFTLGYPAMIVREVVTGMLRGCGYSKMPMVFNLMGMVVFRQAFLAAVMPHYMQVEVVYVAYPLAWYVTVLLLLIYAWRMREKLFR